MYSLELVQDETRAIRELTGMLAARYSSSAAPELLAELPVYGHELPQRLRRFLTRFRLEEVGQGAALVSGLPIPDDRIGSTPSHWNQDLTSNPAIEEELFLLLCSTLLGDALAWSTQQNAKIVHEVLPIRGHEQEQLGTGSEQLLWWHTEDAFHPLRADYIGLMCLRNPDAVPTTLAAIEGIELDPAIKDRLFQPVYTIRPDESHLPKNQVNADDASVRQQGAYQSIERMNSAPEKISVLFGDPQAPYIRLDPYFMDRVPDPDAQAAFDTLVAAIDRALINCALRPGDVLFIDNYRAVHGRQPFRARFDGKDRWLKRVNITRDLRKSRAARACPESRVIY